MVLKPYEWDAGAELQDHSRRKLKILREYIFDYLTVRCQFPQQERFRLAIVDGFAGGGRYRCGTDGSPLIFIQELKNAINELNISRANQGLKTIEVECLLILNDLSRAAISSLKGHVTPMEIEIKQTHPKLHLRVEYMNESFDSAYPQIKDRLNKGRYRNILFNLDQCGDHHVNRNTIVDIMQSYPSVEIFYTFMIKPLITFLNKREPEKLASRLKYLNLNPSDLGRLDEIMSKQEWLGTAEKIVFCAFQQCAKYVSPFSIHNPNGWQYWFIHFANSHRARQVYNNILHRNASLQAHYGRSGLDMLSYQPESSEGGLYLFDFDGRKSAKDQLFGDIPRLVTEVGDAIIVSEFYDTIYKATPAHADDIHEAIIDNPDLEVLTTNGGERRKANTIAPTDTIKLKKQKSFFPMFLGAKAENENN